MQFLTTLLNTPSPTGFEYTGQQVWMDYIRPYVDVIHTDPYGSAMAVINPDAEFKIMIEAHCDEISRYVKYITDDGLLYVLRNGGSDHQIAPSKRVNIHTSVGVVKGVFGWPAIHTRIPGKESPPEKDNIFIDVGCRTKKEVLLRGIQVGDVLTYEDECMVLNDRYIVWRGLDNRMWWFMIAQVARYLSEMKTTFPIGLYIVNSVQEEVGLRGAEMVAQRIKPNIALITDVCHDTSTPMIDKKLEGDTKCGWWPVLSVWPAVHNKLLWHIKHIAKQTKISYQMDARSRYTGTDTDAFAYSNGGIVSWLISLPLRYMHTTVEMVDMDDVAHTIRLLLACITQMDATTDVDYFSWK